MLDNLKILPKVLDEDAARVGMEHWLERPAMTGNAELESAARTISDNASGAALLRGIFANSPYLTQLLLRDQAFAIELLDLGPDTTIAALFNSLRQTPAHELSLNNVMQRLRQAKRNAALAIAIADITGLWSLEQVTDALTEIADLGLSLAWRHVVADAIRAGKLPFEATPERLADPLPGSGLVCLAMGKHGARELNYSSDIDLIVFYDDETPGFSEFGEIQKSFVQMTRQMVKIMEERTPDGYVFRTDLRLRPDASATPLAISVTAAENYYESLGQNWERAAMIKARPVACDMAAAKNFQDRIQPFVWRKFLDFAAVRDIHSIKRQIAAHKGGHEIIIPGHNLKLGRGGIREIEFFVQTQQLIWGGRDGRLREKPTASAMAALVDAGRVTQPIADEMLAAYRFLRTAEHRLQMIADAQTHSLPETEDKLAAVAAFLSFDTYEDFETQLVGHLRTVAQDYGALFEDSAPLSAPTGEASSLVFTGVENDPETVRTLASMGFEDPDQVASRIRAWHHGRYRATRSERARQLLTELVPALLVALGGSSQPDDSFRRFDSFLESLPSGVQLFSLFHSNPGLLDTLADIMGLAPSLARLLGDNPSLLEGILTHDVAAALPDADQLTDELDRDLARARDYEDVLDISRRWINDRRFQIGVQSVRGLVEVEQAAASLSDIVDAAICCLLPRVEEEFSRRHGRIPEASQPALAVIAMGKLGGRELTAGSDLDLVFVYDAPFESESDGEKPLPTSQYFIRLGQRLLAALTVRTSEGGLFEVDMRLRPTGNKGPISTSLETFRNYHADDAWTWERMALTRARVVAGAPELADRLRATITDILSRPRDLATLAQDVASMRERIAGEHKPTSPWAIKHWRGGLVDIEFTAQYLQLREASAHPNVVASNTVTALINLQAIGALSPQDFETLTQAARLWASLQALLRQTIGNSRDPSDIPEGLKARLARVGGAENFEALEADLKLLAESVMEAYNRLVAGPASNSD